MVPKCIILGEISKKLLLPFIFAASQIAHKMFSRYFYPQKKSNMVLDLYFTSFGMMSILFLPCILKIKSVESDKERLIHKKKYLHYFLLGFIFLIYTLMKLIPNIMKGVYALEKNKAINGFSEGAFLIMGIEMIFLAIFSYFLLKYRYYKHHIISMIAFIICGVCCDLFLKYYSEKMFYSLPINLIEFLSILSDSVYYIYQKYMMEKLYYPYWRIGFALGFTYFLFSTAALIYFVSDKDKINSSNIIIKGFYFYFINLDVGLMIGKLLIIYFFITINTALNILMIYYFNPNYILISFQISKFVQVLIDEEKEKFYCIFFFILQFFVLMIYLEILELNFCNLNENTKRNIELRGLIDITGEFGRDSSLNNIEINKDYLINTDMNKENGVDIEMDIRTNSVCDEQENQEKQEN